MPAAAERFRWRRRPCAIVAPEAVKIEAVSKVSTARKLGVVARVAAQQAKRSRTVRAATSAVSTTARAFGRVLHQLWLEVTGLIFLVMAASGGFAPAKEYAKYQAGRVGFRARGGCNLFHSDVCVVWGEFVLEGEAEESRRGWWEPVRAAVA